MHKEYEKMLVNYYNGTCSEEEKNIVKEHLKICDECKKSLMEMQFYISYDIDEEVSTSDEMVFNEPNVKEVSLSTSDVNVNKSEAAADNSVGRKKVKTGKKIGIVSIVIAFIVIVMAAISPWVINKGMLMNSCKEFMEFYNEAYIIPEDCYTYYEEGFSGDIDATALGEYKYEIKKQMREYYIEENMNFYEMYENISIILDNQMYENIELITHTNLITEVKVDSFDFTRGKVSVYFGSGNDEYVYEISCERKGLEWKINNVQMKLGED